MLSIIIVIVHGINSSNTMLVVFIIYLCYYILRTKSNFRTKNI